MAFYLPRQFASLGQERLPSCPRSRHVYLTDFRGNGPVSPLIADKTHGEVLRPGNNEFRCGDFGVTDWLLYSGSITVDIQGDRKLDKFPLFLFNRVNKLHFMGPILTISVAVLMPLLKLCLISEFPKAISESFVVRSSSLLDPERKS